MSGVFSELISDPGRGPGPSPGHYLYELTPQSYPAVVTAAATFLYQKLSSGDL